ncbi:hypothetical protein SCHPADRAFT_235275 [Schizopora paradoxa]|uniref:Uncharacterized protein n=1 Tax=Schizopora paradoxa TaxID=27342 RepID=A0A0H2S2G4_9AGAM|nr:hypothetical protein SCHPADRAFT_235275 [Schizopora paradoxa]
MNAWLFVRVRREISTTSARRTALASRNNRREITFHSTCTNGKSTLKYAGARITISVRTVAKQMKRNFKEP